tara:strand:- start:587 stop:766 length:180 start_codon:yes stop_codon:yes gene_type:complete
LNTVAAQQNHTNINSQLLEQLVFVWRLLWLKRRKKAVEAIEEKDRSNNVYKGYFEAYLR